MSMFKLIKTLADAGVDYVPGGGLAAIVDIGPLKVPVASINHLIVMKTDTGRGKDVIDIEELRKIQAGNPSC